MLRRRFTPFGVGLPWCGTKFVVESSRRVIFAAKLDCSDEQAARHRAEQYVASTMLSFGKPIGSLPFFEVRLSYRQILVTAVPVRRQRLWADGRSTWR